MIVPEGQGAQVRSVLSGMMRAAAGRVCSVSETCTSIQAFWQAKEQAQIVVSTFNSARTLVWARSSHEGLSWCRFELYAQPSKLRSWMFSSDPQDVV
jgi:hypothetical protein